MRVGGYQFPKLHTSVSFYFIKGSWGLMLGLDLEDAPEVRSFAIGFGPFSMYVDFGTAAAAYYGFED